MSWWILSARVWLGLTAGLLWVWKRRRIEPFSHGQGRKSCGARSTAPYVRGKIGTITRDGGIEELQDTDIQGLGSKTQHLYTLRFPARELWDDEASPRDSAYADLWEG